MVLKFLIYILLPMLVQPYLAQTGDEEISREISKLEDKYHEQVKVCFTN